MWVATFKDVSSYVAERDGTILAMTKKGKRYIIVPAMKHDKALFSFPLTMKVDNVVAKKMTVQQNGKNLDLEMKGRSMIFDFDPSGGAITIVMK